MDDEDDNWPDEKNQSFMEKIGTSYDKAWMTFIKPTRTKYSKTTLEPTLYSLSETQALQRFDFQVTNPRGFLLECSLFQPVYIPSSQMKTCLIYLHSQTGNRVEGLFLRDFCAQNNIFLCVFDFSACGLSQGKYISLGHFERDDLAKVIDYVQAKFVVDRFSLWGRSMGGVTAITYAERNLWKKQCHLSCLILDSPFTDVSAMVADVGSRKMRIPSFVSKMGMSIITTTIVNKIGYDISKLKPLKLSKVLKMPAAFIRAMQDTLVYPDRIEEYYRGYTGKSKLLITSQLEHNSEREDEVLKQAFDFILLCLSQESMMDVHEVLGRHPVQQPVSQEEITGISRKSSGEADYGLAATSKRELQAFFESLPMVEEKPVDSKYQQVYISPSDDMSRGMEGGRHQQPTHDTAFGKSIINARSSSLSGSMKLVHHAGSPRVIGPTSAGGSFIHTNNMPSNSFSNNTLVRQYHPDTQPQSRLNRARSPEPVQAHAYNQPAFGSVAAPQQQTGSKFGTRQQGVTASQAQSMPYHKLTIEYQGVQTPSRYDHPSTGTYANRFSDTFVGDDHVAEEETAFRKMQVYSRPHFETAMEKLSRSNMRSNDDFISREPIVFSPRNAPVVTSN